MTVDELLKVGVLMPKKKWTKHGLENCPRINFIFLTPQDLTASKLISLGISLLLHKIVDLLLPSEQVEFISEELKKWDGKVIDDFEKVELLCDRRRTCQLLHWFTNIHENITLPPTDECIVNTTLKFPVIRKPIIACSYENSHLMCLFYSSNQLESSPSYILQQFVPHAGILYKVYVIGNEQRIQVRPSLETTVDDMGSEPRPFDSQSMKLKGAFVPGGKEYAFALERIKPYWHVISQFSDALRIQLGLTLFGWDLIVEEDTDHLFIIDVNYFPGYDETDFLNLLCDYILLDYKEQ